MKNTNIISTPRYKRASRLVLAALTDYHYNHKKPLSQSMLIRHIAREYHVHEGEFRDVVPYCVANGIAFGAIRRKKGLLILGQALHPCSVTQLPTVKQALKLGMQVSVKRLKRNKPNNTNGGRNGRTGKTRRGKARSLPDRKQALLNFDDDQDIQYDPNLVAKTERESFSGSEYSNEENNEIGCGDNCP